MGGGGGAGYLFRRSRLCLGEEIRSCLTVINFQWRVDLELGSVVEASRTETTSKSPTTKGGGYFGLNGSGDQKHALSRTRACVSRRGRGYQLKLSAVGPSFIPQESVQKKP